MRRVVDAPTDSGLPRTTVHRIRSALEHEDLIYIDLATVRLHLGPGVMRLAMATRDLPSVVRPYLERVSRELNETADLGVLDGCTLSLSSRTPHRNGRSWSSPAADAVLIAGCGGRPWTLRPAAVSRDG